MIAPTEPPIEAPAGLVFHQDPVEELLNLFDGAFRIVVPGPGRQVVGLKSISEKQDGAPGWYLWFEDRPGAYLLELAEAGTVGRSRDSRAQSRETVQGSFRIKYYPDAEDTATLSLFAASEQVFRQSDCFDQTGTPDFTRGEEIPEGLFQIGTLAVGITAGAEAFVLRLQARDRWVTWSAEGITAADAEGRLHCLREAGEKDRDVPAWEWSWFLFDRLVRTLCLAHGTRPWRVSLHEAPGHAFRVHAGGFSQALADPAVRQRWLSVSVRHAGGGPPGIGAAFPAEDPSLILEAPAGRGILSLFREPAESTDWIPPIWWHVRESRLDFGSVLPC